MRAEVIYEYGPPDVFKLEDISQPVPGPHEVLIEVKCASINPVDWKIRNGDLSILIPKHFPRVIGVDVAGVVAQVGSSVKNLKVGDSVFGMSNPMRTQFGSYAQFSIAQKDGLATKPDALSFADAAAIPVAGLTAYKALINQIKLQPDQKVLINGASGGVGTFAVQIAKSIGARITATCGKDNIEFVRSLGADVVIDYTQQDARKLDEKFHGILDASAKWNFSSVKGLLTKNGVYVTTVPNPDVALGILLGAIFPGKRAYIVSAGSGSRVREELTDLAAMILSGKIRVITADTVPLEEVAKAHAVSQTGHARGKTIVRISD